ncbi:YceI family protein [Neolewinella lacunae]|uniref:YceI family protein n=1 Tax=Neolewinella lacunae TaxID=1517758 RepID=A0A923PND5_9BACT|nr:YceI family protein [Neolewinella lacunae]MBC6994489.1 YceI family protein [Neolewinella lacunae]MDN3634182.1 YceI family protein [Neolewinella lacunae]
MFKSLLLFTAFLFTVTTVAVKVDPAASVVTWKGYKVTGEHTGTIKVQDGQFEFNDGQLTGGSFTIAMNSITCTDLQGGAADKLVGHLKSADFFGVEKFPAATFKITKVVSRGTPGDYRVTGDLTIKETTKEVRFNANVTENAGSYVATADLKLDRSDFDVRYGSGSFFDNLGDKTIYDEFDLNIKLVTEKKMK